jgi:hypothetical protein
MANPYDKFDSAELNAVAQSAVSGVGATPKGAAILASRVAEQPIVDEFGRPVDPSQMEKKPLSSVERMARIKADPVYQFGEELQQGAREAYPVPEEQEKNWGVKFSRMVGGFLPLLGSGPLAPATIGLQSIGDRMGEAYESEIGAGKTPEEAAAAAEKQALASGALQATLFKFLPEPLKKTTDKLIVDRMSKSLVSEFFAKRGAQAVQGGIEGAASMVGENVIAGKPLEEGVGEGAAALSALNTLMPRGASAAKAKTPSEKILSRRVEETAPTQPVPEAEPTAGMLSGERSAPAATIPEPTLPLVTEVAPKPLPAEKQTFGGVEYTKTEKGWVDPEGKPIDPSVEELLPSAKALDDPKLLENPDAWADKVLADRKGQVSSNIDPELATAYVIKGSMILSRGVKDFATWSTEMVKEFGESIKAQLDVLWAETNKAHEGLTMTRRASGVAASPVVTDINFDRARRNLTSADQASFKMKMQELAPDATVSNAIGDWADGAENSVAAVFDYNKPVEELRRLAASAGLARDQKAALWWTTDPNGKDATHFISWPKDVSIADARQAMIDAGLENRTLTQTADGIQGFVFDGGQQNLNKIKQLHEHSTKPSIESSAATGDFPGDFSSRAAARRAYRNILGGAEEAPAREGIAQPEIVGVGNQPEPAGITSDLLASEPVKAPLATEVPAKPELIKERPDLPVTSALNTLYARESALPVSGKRTNSEVAQQIQEAAIDHWGGEPVTSKTITPEQESAIVDNAAQEVLAGLKQGGNAADWYTTAVKKALAIARVLHPELASDKAAQAAGFSNAKTAELGMATALAITSQNLNVTQNTRFANEQFKILKETGRFDPSIDYGTKAESISGNLELANKLLDLKGWDGVNELLNKEFTVGELSEIASQITGKDAKIAGRVNDIVNGSALFGPKIGGGFLQNLLGNFNPVTVDLWMRRTWGRWTGDVLPDPVNAVQIARMVDGLKEVGIPLPEVLKGVRTVSQGGKKGTTISEKTAERLLSNPESVNKIYSAADELDSRWNKVYDQVRNGITPEQAAAVRDGSLSLEALSKQLVKPLRDREAAWVKFKEGSETKLSNKDREAFYQSYDASKGRTETLTNKELSGNKPTWAKAARVISNILKPVDVPSDQDREVINRIVNKVRVGLEQRGMKTTNADIQAILWYPEKDIWAKLAGDSESNLKNSYDEEFLKLAKAQGLGEQANNALQAFNQ